jgi:hypothetical protein
VCGVIVIRHFGVDMLRVLYNYCDTTCLGRTCYVCGIIIWIRVFVDMLHVWYNYSDTCWERHVTCME